ncbi:MAG: HEPN domain-containing protein [Lysobacterales bacterium]
MTTTALKQRLKRDAERYPDATRVRLHRALSWLGRAEREDKDPDAAFIFLWIAFNAAYAREFGQDETERKRFGEFLAMLIAVDTPKVLHDLVFSQYSGPVRTLIENEFVFEPFWTALRGHDSSKHWERVFRDSRKAALKAVMHGNTATVLSIVFDRLYVLRNQLIHGGATWNGKLNRAQVKDGVRILGAIIPVILALMLDRPDLEFGDVLYPAVG